MFPLFPFVAGVLTGAVALRLIKTDKTKAGLDKAQDKLRDATVSSLEAIEHASARARKRLTAAEADEDGESMPAEAAEPSAPAARKRAPRAAKAAPKVDAAAGKEDAES
ncbi:MAG TPA: hypothetical protein P5537_06845 [Thauera sp.]|jgi:hypothetical protein|uniref:hypothetical protein n=1 Tax=Thauera sp. TaxID=1905334 RepID=UPI000F92C678|nr:hypothetical protein [Thauera sp.]RTL19740.1 MAG: hypothetical protein EKK55_18925 [Rhodocyclaceae bacterium]MCB1946854.1 hypothetical protein [Thauera sp.]MCP5225413.1 hypothetical protein [Thauera sp.]HPE03998.1 hypothetical protein [Thauera sp.]HRV77795.1 hypothetical protein [Thauera sp.]